MKSHHEIREKLWTNVRLFRSEMSGLGIDISPSVSRISPLKIRNNKQVKDLSAQLLEMGKRTPVKDKYSCDPHMEGSSQADISIRDILSSRIINRIIT